MNRNIVINGQKYGRLTVIKETKPIVYSRRKHRACICQCECGNIVTVALNKLLIGHTSSCGCLRRERIINSIKKYNSYVFQSDCVIGYTEKGDAFKIDIDDYETLKQYYWNKDKYGYFVTQSNKKQIKMHRMILDAPSDMMVDHINHDIADNRKSNLRLCNKSQNGMNRKCKGYGKTPASNTWRAYITVNQKQIHLGCFKTEKEAIAARKKAEEKYFKDFSYKERIENASGI